MRNTNFSILGDNPANKDTDLLGFDSFVQPLADRLLASVENTPFTVGVFAEWGQGKTTIMHILRGHLADRGCTTIWFEPWKYNTREDAWKGLVLTLVSAIQKGDNLWKEIRRKNPGLKALLAEGLWSTLLGRSWGEKLVKTVQQEPWSPSSLHEFEKTLDTLFDFIQPKHGVTPIVLFVDDLDRCLPQTALAVLEALKLVVARPGLITILGIAEDELSRAILAAYAKELKEGNERIDPEWGRLYLRKIVQMPFWVPVVTEATLGNYVDTCLERSHIADVLPEKQRWLNIIGDACEKNLREIKRFINCYICDLDKATANLRLMGQDRVGLDPARVAFILLLSTRYPNFLRHIKNRADDPELFIRYQLFFSTVNYDVEPNSDEWKVSVEHLQEEEADFSADRDLAAFFQGLLAPPNDETPVLVRPFSDWSDLLPYLQFGTVATMDKGSEPQPVEFAAEQSEETAQQGDPEDRRIKEQFARAQEMLSAGAYAEAKAELTKVLKSTERSADLPGRLTALHQLGLVHLKAGEPESAQKYFEDALAIAATTQNPHDEARISVSVADALFVMRKSSEALEHLSRANSLMQQVGDRRGHLTVLRLTSQVLLQAEDLEGAFAAAEQALNLSRQIHHLPDELLCLKQLAIVAAKRDEPGKALASTEQAISLAEKLRDPQEMVAIHQLRAHIYEQLKDNDKARVEYEVALEHAEGLQQPYTTVQVLHPYANLLTESGQLVEAREVYLLALGLAKEGGVEPKQRGILLASLGNVSEQLQGLDKARVYYHDAREQFLRAGDSENAERMKKRLSDLTDAPA